MEATTLNQKSINAYKTLMLNPKENGLDMPALHDCFEEGEGTPKHILFDQYIEKIQKPLPKVFFYIIMDEIYADKITKCADGNIGYKLKIK